MAQFKYTGIERRRFVRIPSWFITNYRIYPHNIEFPEMFHHGIGKNISAGGICFEARHRFDKDAILEIEIDMPALEHAVRIIGQVAWARPLEGKSSFIYGIAFTKINSDDIEAVKKIVDTFA